MVKGLTLWGSGVALASATGLLAKVPTRLVGPIIAGGIVVPTVIYARSPRLQARARAVGIHNISLFHMWRVAGTVAFLRYGARDKLPPSFVRNAAWGDLVTSALAAALMVLPRRRATYLAFHAVGFADFLTALATGLTLTQQGDPRMRTVVTFPLALIPFFGVGLSGAAHLIAFDLLREA
jgi:hypothetical protein